MSPLAMPVLDAAQFDSTVDALEDTEAPRAGIDGRSILWVDHDGEDGRSRAWSEPIVHRCPTIGGTAIGALKQPELGAGINDGWCFGIDRKAFTIPFGGRRRPASSCAAIGAFEQGSGGRSAVPT